MSSKIHYYLNNPEVVNEIPPPDIQNKEQVLALENPRTFIYVQKGISKQAIQQQIEAFKQRLKEAAERNKYSNGKYEG